MSLIFPVKLNLSKRLKEDQSFRKKFFHAFTADEIAMGLRGLRKKRTLSQPELSNKAGMKQSAISRIEQAEYAAWNYKTLLRVADALNARVRVIFELAEDVIAKYEQSEAHQKTLQKAQYETFEQPVHTPDERIFQEEIYRLLALTGFGEKPQERWRQQATKLSSEIKWQPNQPAKPRSAEDALNPWGQAGAMGELPVSDGNDSATVAAAGVQ
jgi:transcriptional regulator with XRE-family HTH domain